MDLFVRTAPEDGDRHRQARARVRPGLWERCRPILGWTLAVLFAALVFSGVARAFHAAAAIHTGG